MHGLEAAIRFFEDYDTVDVGVAEYNYRDADGKSRKTNLEIDFIASEDSRKYYIQSALSVGEEEKRLQEVRPYMNVGDSFKKIIVVKDHIMLWHDERGVLYMELKSSCLIHPL